MQLLRIATRQSRLALWQARDVAQRLERFHPNLTCELVPITTKGDRFLDAPLAKIGGKGLFVKELEQAMFDGLADIAVHSMKDVTVDMPDGLHLPVIMERASPLDALVWPAGDDLDALPAGSHVGSSSLRRQSQLRHLRPDLRVSPVRGNVDTRLAKLDAGEFDALILACAGLERLELDERISQTIGADVMVPAIGQGAMGIQCRENDRAVEDLIGVLNHPKTQIAVRAERAMNRKLNGGCHAPVAGFATIDGDALSLHGLAGSVDGREIIDHVERGAADAPESVGERAADALAAKGALRLLAEAAPDMSPDASPDA